MAAKLVLKGRFAATCSLSTVIDRLARTLMVISQEFRGVSASYNIISFYDPADSSASLVSFVFLNYLAAYKCGVTDFV